MFFAVFISALNRQDICCQTIMNIWDFWQRYSIISDYSVAAEYSVASEYSAADEYSVAAKYSLAAEYLVAAEYLDIWILANIGQYLPPPHVNPLAAP